MKAAASTPDAEDALASLLTSLNEATTSASAASNAAAAAAVRALHQTWDGPHGVVSHLLPRIWLPTKEGSVQGDDALRILIHLVESRPSDYMSLVASSVRRDVEQFAKSSHEQEQGREVSDALILALAKLLVGPSSDDQVGIATDASASLLELCRWDAGRNHCDGVAKRVISTIDDIWYHLLQQGREQQRQSSASQMRIAALMIDVCLLGGLEMALVLDGNGMDKLLQVSLDFPNDDPLLQVSALDQLERLTVHDDPNYPMSTERADFLLSNDVLRRGLLCLVGSPGDLSRDANESEGWRDADPINGGAALRLLTEICRVGVSWTDSISASTRDKFQLLLSNFLRALHSFDPRGELERLSYIYAASALVGSCAMVASSSTEASAAHAANAILSDGTLLHEWLSLHSRVSQPKLKSTVLCSLSQALEPAMWKDDAAGSSATTARPSDAIALQLYQAFSRANNERDSTELILASAKSPFIEERLGAYNILRALVMRGVGVRLLLLYNDGTGGGSSFLDWLLNQELESDSEGRKAKYQIAVSMLSENSNLLGGLIPARALQQLEEWKRNGPNYKAVPMEMATE